MADMLARHQMEVCVQKSLLFSFSMIFNITEREYCISSVSLLHTCEEEARQKRLPVSSGYLKKGERGFWMEKVKSWKKMKKRGWKSMLRLKKGWKLQ
jgi:hypothetical protein